LQRQQAVVTDVIWGRGVSAGGDGGARAIARRSTERRALGGSARQQRGAVLRGAKSIGARGQCANLSSDPDEAGKQYS